jgi:predicted transcriptional regulator
MKNITFSADEDLIEEARSIARAQRKTLNEVFREWLAQYTARSGGATEFDSLMKGLRRVNAGRKFRRDEMND